MSGKVIPHTPLAVDFWQVRKCPHIRLFFLSHMHSDHTVGLTSTWTNWPIYCSPITATLLRLKLQVKERWIHPLEVGDSYILPLDDIGKEKLTVTLMDAEHCPGAVMFLFQGYFGTILYTADFRYSPKMLLAPCLKTTIDVMYLDNTNCDPNRTLPTRKQATQQIKEIIRSHAHHDVVIGLYALGKESLMVELAKEFKTWVEVSFDRMETLKTLDLPDVFTTDEGAGRIRVVKQSQICSASLHQWNEQQPTLAILPTSRPMVLSHPNLYVVPYSDHSSYQEMEDFVCALQPTSLVPILGDCLPESLYALLPNKKRQEILVPESVRHYMLRQHDNQLSSSTHSSFRRRHFQFPAPKGVVFDSPVRASMSSFEDTCACGSQCVEREASEEEMDTESRDRHSDYGLINSNKKCITNIDRGGAGDVCSINSGCANPKNTVRRLFETNGDGKISDTAAHENPTTQHRGRVYAVDNRTLSDDESMSQSDRCGNDQDDSAALLQKHPENHSCPLCCSLNELTEEYMMELENRLLNNLPFQKEDFETCEIVRK